MERGMSASLNTAGKMGSGSTLPAADQAALPAMSASDRLILSRARLRQAMRPPVTPPGHIENQRLSGSPWAWTHSLKSLPGASLLIDALETWWAQHPLRVTGMVANDALKAMLQPTAQRHPLGLVAGGVLLGGLLAWARPWRLLSAPALFAGLLPQILSKAVRLLPPQSWIVVLASLAQQQCQPKKSNGLAQDARQEQA
jgi:hypothetical protein